MKSTFALLLCLACSLALARPFGGVSPAGSAHYVGVNLEGISYYSSELPFLNIVKSCGGNGVDPQLAWYTASSTGTTGSTGEEGYLALDSNLYPTSLTAVGEGTQTFTSVNCLLNYSVPTAPGASLPYGTAASTSYRLKYTTTAGTGSSTVVIGGDGTASLTCAANTTCTQTFSVSPNNGMILAITAIGASSHPTDISVVETPNVSAYDGGAIFNPQFLAALTGYSRLRFMDWNSSNYQVNYIAFTAAMTSGQTSATLTTAWKGGTGTYQLMLGTFTNNTTAETISATLTFNSTAVTFATGLANTYSSGGVYAYAPLYSSWATRSTTSTAFWQTVPYEVQMALCNQLAVDCWICVPIWANATAGSSAYWTSLATLTQATLNSGRKLYVEYSNEIWNGGFPQNGYAQLAGLPQFWVAQGGYYGSMEWQGTQVAQIADAFYAVYGSTAFNSGVVVSIGSQFTGAAAWTQVAMNTPDWTSRAYSHHIGAWHIAPYFSETDVSNADANTILASPNPLNTFFCLFYTNVCGGTTYASVPSNGWLPRTAIDAAAQISAATSAQPWASLPVLGYESGSGFNTNGTPTNGNTAFTSLIVSAHRDVRMGYLYYDPTHQLTSNNGYLPGVYAAGLQSINQFNDVSSPSQYGEWGAAESAEQTFSPKTSAPYKWQAIESFIQ